MRRLAGFLLLLGLFLAAAEPARAAYPAPWPDNGSGDVNTGWVPYTYQGVPVKDKEGSQDPSTGGTTPTTFVDVVSDGQTRPSVYYAYDATNQVFFFRFRLASASFTATPNGGSNDDPLSASQWNVLMDTDGDGYREFIISLDGRSGVPGNPIDDIVVYYGNDASNAFPATIPYTGKAGVFTPTVDADARTTVIDVRTSREIDKSLTGGTSYFLDFQLPMSAFNVSGQQLIGPNTRVALGWATANSNVNPFQKDAAFDGAITPTVDGIFPFGDILTPSGGLTQDPFVLDVTASCARPADVLQVQVWDTLNVVGGVATNTIADVKFYYQPDADGNGTPDAGTSPFLITTLTTPKPGRLDLFEYSWDTTALPGGTYDIYAVVKDTQGNTATSPSVVCTYEALPGNVSGHVYEDADHDKDMDPEEAGTGLNGLYVKIIPAAGGNALAAGAVDPGSGAWFIPTGTFPTGNYFLRLDNNNTLTDTTAYRPSGWIGTQAPDQERSLAWAGVTLAEQNFGLFHGSRISGKVFLDDGSGGGTPHDGIQQPGEPGLTGVSLHLLDGSTELDAPVTSGDGSWSGYLSAALDGKTLIVEEVNPANSTSVSGSPGDSGGTYDLATDRTTFTYALTQAFYTGLDFGDVGATLFLDDNQGQAEAGGILFYPHRFVAGTAGTVTFTVARVSQPATPEWSSALYRDLDADGVLDPGEPAVTGGLAVTAGQKIHLLLKEFVPPSAAEGSRDQVTVTATLAPGGSVPDVVLTRTDLTTVTGGASVALRKVVDQATARSGQTLTYTITYENRGVEALNALVIHDRTPAYTTFVAASNGTLPAGLTGCTASTPAVGAEGTLTWTFTGTLRPGASGTVTFQVKVR